MINIGDLMARWTNDRWRSTLHRVVDPPDPAAAAARRQSMPYFQNANWSAEISCLPTCLGPGEKPRYEPVLAGPHLMAKFRRSVTLPPVDNTGHPGETFPWRATRKTEPAPRRGVGSVRASG